jgi:general secretion pathway protein F
MSTADLMRHHGLELLLGAIAAGFLLRHLVKSEKGRKLWDRAVLGIPLFGEMLRKSAIARWARASSALLAGGVPLLETLHVVRGLFNNSSMIAMIEHALQRVSHGQSLAKSVDEHNLLPPAVIHLLTVGERTGRLAEMFEHVAKMAERQLRNQIRVVLNLLPPILIMGLAVMVATIAMAVLLPIFRLNSMMR